MTNQNTVWVAKDQAPEFGLEVLCSEIPSLPKGGILAVLENQKLLGWIGFRPFAQDSCQFFGGAKEKEFDWSEPCRKVLNQATKSKYIFAELDPTVLHIPNLLAFFEAEGFEGDPTRRRLVPDLPSHLLPHFDWKGRLTSLSAGKGSESINHEIYEIIARSFPVEGHFTELQVNKLLNELHTFRDASALRRELVDRGYVGRTRDCRDYWKIENPEIIGR